MNLNRIISSSLIVTLLLTISPSLSVPTVGAAPELEPDVSTTIQDDLVSFWSLNEVEGDTYYDQQGIHDLGAGGSPVYSDGVVGNAVSLNPASSQYLLSNSTESLTTGDSQDFSVSMWVKLNNKDTKQVFVSKHESDNGEYAVFYDSDLEKFVFSTYQAEEGEMLIKADAFGSPVINTWYHIVAVHDSAAETNSIYVNHVNTNLLENVTEHVSTGGPFVIGAFGPTQEYYLDGYIDSVGFWKKPLTAGEIEYLYNNGFGREFEYFPLPGAGTSEYPYLISTCEGLQTMNLDSTAYFELTEDIDCSMTNPEVDDFDDDGTWADGAGFVPIGGSEFSEGGYDPFTGFFNGGKYKINGLYINRPDIEQVGLFGTVAEGEIYDVELVDVMIYGGSSTGSIVGLNGGDVYRVSAIGVVESDTSDDFGYLTGGLVGVNFGLISKSYADVVVTGRVVVGGLVGLNVANAEIYNSFSRSSADASVQYAGGLVGVNFGSILKSYSLGVPSGLDSGGLVGSYTEDDVYDEYASVNYSFWNVDTSGVSQESEDTGIFGTPKSYLQMQDIDTFTTELGENDWSFDKIWMINPNLNNGYPYLTELGAPETDDDAIAEEPSDSSGGSSGSRNSKSNNLQDSNQNLTVYEKEIAEVLAKKIITKNPETSTNKCEVLTIMSRAFNWKVPTVTTSKYTDVPEWCVSVAAFGTNRGIVEGRTATTIGIETPLTRYEIAIMLYRELKKQNYEFKGVKTVNFSDGLLMWAKEPVETLAKEGIINGFSNGTFGGMKGILKQDAAIMMLRFLKMKTVTVSREQ